MSRLATVAANTLLIAVAFLGMGHPVEAATATFTPVGPTIVQPGTVVTFDVTVTVGSLAEFNTADVIIGSTSATDIGFTYSAEWNAAFANVTSPTFDTGLYPQDVHAGGNNASPVGTTLLLGTITIETTGMSTGFHDVRVDNALDGFSTLGLGGIPDPVSGTGVFEIQGCNADLDCDDGVTCTTDTCNLPTGACSNTTDDSACDDGLFCTGVESCDAVAGCVVSGNPCLNPVDCDEIAGNCGCQLPTVRAIGPRYLEITPAPGQTDIAFLVEGVDPDVACVSSYAQTNGTLDVSATQMTPSEWGTFSLRSDSLVAGRNYTVRSDCDPANPGTVLSPPASATLWRWGDSDLNGVVDILDITRSLDEFRGLHSIPAVPCVTDADCSAQDPNFSCDQVFGLCIQSRLENVDLIGPQGCEPDNVVSIVDVVWFVNAFRAQPHDCTGPCAPF